MVGRSRGVAIWLAAGIVSMGGAAESTSAQTETVHVIVHADSPIDSLTVQEVRQIFTARRLRYGDVRLVVALNPNDPDIYASFARALTGRSSRALGLLWLEAGFRNAAPDPVLVRDEAEMITYVESTPSAVGYASPGALPPTVRVVGALTLTDDR